jgi:hypothetical protein
VELEAEEVAQMVVLEQLTQEAAEELVDLKQVEVRAHQLVEMADLAQ